MPGSGRQVGGGVGRTCPPAWQAGPTCRQAVRQVGEQTNLCLFWPRPACQSLRALSRLWAVVLAGVPLITLGEGRSAILQLLNYRHRWYCSRPLVCGSVVTGRGCLTWITDAGKTHTDWHIEDLQDFTERWFWKLTLCENKKWEGIK